MKIAVYAISKNEEQFVKRFCESAKDADAIFIADTGSTDNTIEIAINCGAIVNKINILPWRFDKARDTALALIPADFDVCISLDLDEILEPGWREEIEKVWKPETTRLRYKFDWGCGISFYYEKIHHRKGYHWHHPCHEYPKADSRINEVWAHTDMLLVSHHPDPTKSRGQYLDLLKLAVTEDPYCPRNAFYYARELTFYNKWHESIVALLKYLDNPKANWINERCYAMRLLGKAYQNINEKFLAKEWYEKAIAEAPNTREPWIDAATFAYSISAWESCIYYVEKALEIKDKQAVYTMDPEVWESKPYDLIAISAYNLGQYEKAVHYGQLAVNEKPHDFRLNNNLKYYQEAHNGFAN